MLPFKLETMGNEAKVFALVKEFFGVDPFYQDDLECILELGNATGGRAVFISQPDAPSLKFVLDKYSNAADVIFADSLVLKNDFGKLNYIHKLKDSCDIYFIANSSDEIISTTALLRGKLQVKNGIRIMGKF